MAKEFDPIELEKATLKSIPALEEIELDGWLMRFSGGYRHRWNCAIPLEACEDISSNVDQVEKAFWDRDLSPCIKIFPSTQPKLSSVLESRGYDASNRHFVYVRELESFISRPFHIQSVHYNEALTDEWLDAYFRIINISGTQKENAYKLYRGIKNRLISSYYIAGDRITATCLGVLSGDYVIISCTVAEKKYQDREADKALLNKVLERAQSMGATAAIVHALSSDTHNINMYKGQDFRQAYSYIFRKKA